MLQDFLTGRAGLDADSAAQPLAGPRAAGFQPFTTSRVAELTGLGTAGRLPAAVEPERLDAPQVEIVEEEGKVRRIVVTCTCCEKIEIECEY